MVGWWWWWLILLRQRYLPDHTLKGHVPMSEHHCEGGTGTMIASPSTLLDQLEFNSMGSLLSCRLGHSSIVIRHKKWLHAHTLPKETYPTISSFYSKKNY